MQQSSCGSYLDCTPSRHRLGRVDIHSRRPMEALPPRLALDVPANLAPLVRLRTVFLAASTHSVCMPPTKQIFHSCITASLGGASVLSGVYAWREALRTFYLAG